MKKEQKITAIAISLVKIPSAYAKKRESNKNILLPTIKDLLNEIQKGLRH